MHGCTPIDINTEAGIGVAFGKSDTLVAFVFEPVARSDEELHVRLTADRGPFGTTDHIMALTAAPLDTGRTRVTLSASQCVGFAARLAILAYFDSLSAPQDLQPDRRVRVWLAYTQRHPLQPREEPAYFERKVPDVRRQMATGSYRSRSSSTVVRTRVSSETRSGNPRVPVLA